MYITEQQRSELKSIIRDTGSKGLANTLKFKFPYYLTYLKQSYQFLENPHTLQLCYHFYNDINEIVKCKTCGKPVSFRSFTEGYKTYCKGKCTVNEVTKEMSKNTFLSKYVTEQDHIDFCIKHKITRKMTWVNLLNQSDLNLLRHPWKYFNSLKFLSDTSMDYNIHKELIKKYKIYCYAEWREKYIDIMLIEKVRLLNKISRSEHYNHFDLFGEFYTSEEDYLRYKEYRKAVNKLTYKNLRRFGKKQFGENWRKYKKSNNLHVDHNYSVKEGFDNNVKIEIIANINNLRLISQFDNLSKGKRCDITLNELLSKI